MTEVQTYLTPAVTSMLEDDDEKGGVCDGSRGNKILSSSQSLFLL